jgi:hypothetical protein
VSIDGGGIGVNIGDTTTYALDHALSDGSHTFSVTAVDKAGNAGTAASLAFVVGAAPAIISEVTSSAITVTTAEIGWITNGPATSQVEYGLTAGYGSTTELDDSLVTSHTVSLSGLTPNSLYHYRVNGSDCSGHSTFSGDHTFRTAKLTVEVSGPISENTTWTSDSIYLATGNVGVEEGVTLAIEPGTVVKFNPGCALQVGGNLRAEGQADNMIVLTSASDYAWTGIDVLNSASAPYRDVMVSHCVIERANVGLAMGVRSPESEITSNIIRDCSRGIEWLGFSDQAIGGMIRHNEIYSNDFGIYISSVPVDISYNVIRDNDVGLRATGLPNQVVVSHNTIRDNDVGIDGGGYITLQSNNIYSNQTLNLVFDADQPLDATMTWWGTTDESVIQQYIHDYYDDIRLSLVTYKPYATTPIPDAP